MMMKWTARDRETSRGLSGNVQLVLSAVSRCVFSAFDNARRIRKLKEEVATLNAHIKLINLCHADRVVALERDCRQKVDTRTEELKAIVAKVVPPDLADEVQITISGQTARKVWDRFDCLRDGQRAGEPVQDADTRLDCAALDVSTMELFRSIREGSAAPPTP